MKLLNQEINVKFDFFSPSKNLFKAKLNFKEYKLLMLEFFKFFFKANAFILKFLYFFY